jgi:uncharacterized protein
MRFSQALAVATASIFVTTAASAQTIGLAGSKRGFTAQASSAIAKVVSEKTGLKMRAQTFGGSGVYVPQVSAGTLQFGLANELETHFAVTGTGVYKGRAQPDLQIATVLVPFRVALFSKKGSDIKTVADLKGKRVPSGWTSQKIIGVLMDAELANAGLTYDDVTKVPVASVVASADDFAAGKLDVFFFVVGAGKVKETAARVGGIQVVEIDGSPDAVKRMRKFVPPAYATELKPGPQNTGVNKPSTLMAYDYLMLTNKKVPADVVYKTVKAMHDNAKAMAAAFPGMRLFKPDHMTKAFPGVSYHAGAEKYYKEVGQWPPK